LRLAALGAPDAAEHLRLSRAEARALDAFAAAAASTEGPGVDAYRLGAEAAWAGALLRAVALGTPPYPALGAEIARGAAATMPIAARDLAATGIRPGPGLGAALAAAEAAWIASGFTLDAPALLARFGASPEG
ncbi:MAG: CCA tRNA nucleotidyltransferase, partial [Pseudomonadota bacterium]